MLAKLPFVVLHVDNLCLPYVLVLQSAVDEIPADVSSEDETMEAVAVAGAAMRQ